MASLDKPGQFVVAGLLTFVGLGAAVWLFLPLHHSIPNEISVINDLRTINELEQQYSNGHPGSGFACTLHELGSGAQTTSERLSLGVADGRAQGYLFYISECTRQGKQVTSYKANAVPVVIKEGSTRGYCTDQDAQIHYDPDGGNRCSRLVW